MEPSRGRRMAAGDGDREGAEMMARMKQTSEHEGAARRTPTERCETSPLQRARSMIGKIVIAAVILGAAGTGERAAAAEVGAGMPSRHSSESVTGPVTGPATGVLAAATGPLTALSVTAGQLTCIQSAVAVDADGNAGTLAPRIGATVIRGSTSAGPAVSWLVVPRDGLGSGPLAMTTVCTPSP